MALFGDMANGGDISGQGWGGYQPNYQGGYGGGVAGGGYGGGYGGDINPAGAGDDPFAYTKGSLLTPWEGHFSSAGYGGGYAVPAFNPFQFDKFNYKAPDVGAFTENYADPAAFRFADFAGPSQFQAPTAADMYQDPAYQGRVDAASRAAKAAGASSGMLRTGSFVKGMANQAQDLASQEYGNVYNRRKGEWDTEYGRAKDIYGINQGNTKQAFDTNVSNRLNAYKTRQGTWQANADIGLRQGELGYNVATGTYDRNLQLARQQYEDQAAHDAAVASAANAGSSQSYERGLQDYTMARDEFWTNQDRQYALLDREANRGMDAANAYGGAMMGTYGNMANAAIGAGDARASGMMGSANAWGGAISNAGNAAGGALLYGTQRPGGYSPSGGGYSAPRMPGVQPLRSMPGQQMGMPQAPQYGPSSRPYSNIFSTQRAPGYTF